MKNLVLSALLITLLVTGLANSSQPALAQEGPSLDATLAQAAAKGFLTTLVRPELSATRSFYLTETARDNEAMSALAELTVSGFSITQSEWLADGQTLRVTAALKPGSQQLTLDSAQVNGRWRVVDLALSEVQPQAQPAQTAAQPNRSTGLPGTLVFQTRSGGDIYAINANGAGLRFLTTGLDPQLSPDGSQITFTRWEPRYELFVMNLDGAGERSLTQNWRQMKAPTWLADGQSIVFSYQSGGRLSEEERSIDIEEAVINEDSIRIPSEARDIEQEDGIIRYRLPLDAHWYLKEVTVADSKLTDLATGQYSYSPFGHPTDPNQVIYTYGGSGIAMYDGATNTTRPVTTDANDRAPVLSPDGQRVAVSYWQHDHWEVHTFNLDGSNRQRLTETPLTVLAERTALRTEDVAGKERAVAPEQPHWNNAAPAWSPDGSQIAFLTDRTGRWEVWVMNADGSNERPMFPNGELDGLTFDYAGVDEHVLSWR